MKILTTLMALLLLLFYQPQSKKQNPSISNAIVQNDNDELQENKILSFGKKGTYSKQDSFLVLTKQGTELILILKQHTSSALRAMIMNTQ